MTIPSSTPLKNHNTTQPELAAKNNYAGHFTYKRFTSETRCMFGDKVTNHDGQKQLLLALAVVRRDYGFIVVFHHVSKHAVGQGDCRRDIS